MNNVSLPMAAIKTMAKAILNIFVSLVNLN